MSHSLIRTTRPAGWPLALLMVASLAGGRALAAGETITVDTLNDRVDFGGGQQVPDLPGPDGRISFREACTAVNNTPGPQTIEFTIPQSEWWLMLDRALLRLENGQFRLSDDETTVDFTTQTSYTGNTNPNGNEVGIYGLEANAWGVTAIRVSGNNCTIKGLDRVMQRGHGVQISGNNNRVVSCTISGPLYSGVYITGGFGGPTPTGNVVGGTAPGEGNVLSAGNDGVRIDAPAAGNVVIGNVLSGSYHGASIRGSIYTTRPENNRVGGPTPEERNVISRAGRYGEEGFPDGAQVNVEYADGTIIEGNYIGTTADGAASAGQIGPVGVRLLNSNGTIIRGNLISGIAVQGTNHYAGQRFGVGISVVGQSNGTLVVGNRIGLDAAGQVAVPNRRGIQVAPFPGSGGPTNTNIGGRLPGQGNEVAFSELAGVSVSAGVSGVTVSGGAIRANGGLGIDLDLGANGGQAAPILTAATSRGSSVTVEGTLTTIPNTTFDIEFFANAVCDPSGFGEGELFLGDAAVTTNAAGQAAFSIVLPASVPEGQYVTTTATHIAAGNTSEFSGCQVVVAGALRGDFDGDGDVDLSDFVTFQLCFGGSNNPPAPTCPPGIDADLDGDGDVDLADFLIFQQNFTGSL